MWRTTKGASCSCREQHTPFQVNSRAPGVKAAASLPNPGRDRAVTFFAVLGIVVERVLTDNGPCYRGRDFNDALGAVAHSYTRPYRPATNGKVCEHHRGAAPGGLTL